MRLSKLQKYILAKSYEAKNRTERLASFFKYYDAEERVKNKKSIQDILHKSLESLTANDLIVSFGRKTAQKWFISKIKLTASGMKMAKIILAERQKKLPIKYN
jgi:hypothetical protein